jgi:hypothetical protein
MLGDQKDAKKVAGREVWAAAGAVAGHLVQSQLVDGSEGSAAAPSAPLLEENAKLRQQVQAQSHHLTEQSRRHHEHLTKIDGEVDALIAAYEEGQMAEEEAPAPPPRRVVRVGNGAAAPSPRQAMATARRAPAPAPAAPAPRRRSALALPDYGVQEDPIPTRRQHEYADLDRDSEAVFGR